MPQYTVTIEALKFHKITQATTGTTTTVVVCSHSSQALDFFVNVTRNTMPPVRYNGVNARRKIESVTTVSFTHTASITGQTKTDWIALYTFQDVTKYVCQNSINITQSIHGDDTAQFDAIQTYTPPGSFLRIAGWDEFHSTAIDDIGKWDIYSKAWSLKTPIGQNRLKHVAGSINSLAYIATGRSDTGLTTSIYDASVYNLSADSHAAIEPLTSRYFDAQSCVFDDKFWTYGGVAYTAGYIYYSSGDYYDPTSDTWNVYGAVAPFDEVFSGDGINICYNIFFLFYNLYYTTVEAFSSADSFIDLMTQTFATYFVNHSSPNRRSAKAGYKIDEYKCLIVGGSTNLAPDLDSINNVTAINWLGKVYAERQAFPKHIQEGFCSQYAQYSIYAAGADWYLGMGNEQSYIYNNLSDSWSEIEVCGIAGFWGSAAVV